MKPVPPNVREWVRFVGALCGLVSLTIIFNLVWNHQIGLRLESIDAEIVASHKRAVVHLREIDELAQKVQRLEREISK